jgi:hypothetical protein
MIGYFERRAIWEANGKRCAYCGEPLTFKHLEIDHVIPRMVRSDEAAWTKCIQSQGLLSDFDIDGFENLLPSCRPCNARKRDIQFSDGRTAIELGVSRLKMSYVKQLASKFRTEEADTRFRFQIAGAIETGKVTAAELRDLAARVKADRGIFPMRSVFEVFGDRSIRDVSREDYENFLDQKSKLPEDMEKGLRLVSSLDVEIYVQTPREYQAARDRGYFAMTTFEMAMEHQYFTHPLTLMRLFEHASMPEVSYMDEPKRGLSDIELLPATLLFVTEDMTSDPAFGGQREKLSGKSIQDVVTSGEAKISRVSSDSISIEYDGGVTFLMEIMRADIDGDGIEDLVIHWGAGPTDGTYRTATLLVLTRHGPDEAFKTIKVDGVLAER